MFPMTVGDETIDRISGPVAGSGRDFTRNRRPERPVIARIVLGCFVRGAFRAGVDPGTHRGNFFRGQRFPFGGHPLEFVVGCNPPQ